MSQVGTLEAGSRHDLRVGLSPDAPDEEDLARRRGRVRLRALLRVVVPLRWAGRARGAVRVGMPAALHLLPQSRYLASEGRHPRLGSAGARSAEGLCAGAALARRRADHLRRRADGADGVHPADSSPAPRRWGCTPRSRRPAISVTRSTIATCRRSIWCCSTSRAPIPKPTSKVTGRDLAPTLRFAERLAKIGKPAWVRFTLVPGQTDDPANVDGIARFVAPMKNVEWVEVQPFHQMGAFKWKAMNIEYKHRRHAAAAAGIDRPRDRAIPRGRLQRAMIELHRHVLRGDFHD